MQGDEQPLLAARDVSKIFSSSGASLLALDNVSLDVGAGEFVTIVGPSGCGKSTLLHMIGGFDQPSGGRIELSGRTITAPGPERGMMFQDLSLFPWLTVAQNVQWPLDVKGLPRNRKETIVADILALVHLHGMGGLFPGQLSGGMRQRTALARLLALDPQMMLMDEPFGALDSQTRELLQEELQSIWRVKRKTILFVTHDIDEAIFMGTRVIVFSGRPGSIKADIAVPAGPIATRVSARRPSIRAFASRSGKCYARKSAPRDRWPVRELDPFSNRPRCRCSFSFGGRLPPLGIMRRAICPRPQPSEEPFGACSSMANFCPPSRRASGAPTRVSSSARRLARLPVWPLDCFGGCGISSTRWWHFSIPFRRSRFSPLSCFSSAWAMARKSRSSRCRCSFRSSSPRAIPLRKSTGSWSGPPAAWARAIFISSAVSSFPPPCRSLLAGARVGLSLAFVLLFAAELIGSKDGLGHLIHQGEEALRFDLMLAAIAMFGLLGFCSDAMLM